MKTSVSEVRMGIGSGGTPESKKGAIDLTGMAWVIECNSELVFLTISESCFWCDTLRDNRP